MSTPPVAPASSPGPVAPGPSPWMPALAAFAEWIPMVGKPMAELLRKGAWQPLVLMLAVL